MTTLSEQLRVLADRAASIEAHAEAARAEATETRDEHVAQSQARLKQQQGEFSARVTTMSDDSKHSWSSVQKKFKDTGDKMRSKAKENAHNIEAKDAKISADIAEDFAYDAVQFALLAVAEADAAVLESIVARAHADAMAAV